MPGVRPNEVGAVRPADVAESVRRVLAKFPSVAVRGVPSEVHRSKAGHLYFTLADGGASFRCVLYRARARRDVPAGDLADWREAVASGRLTLNADRGALLLVVLGLGKVADG